MDEPYDRITRKVEVLKRRCKKLYIIRSMLSWYNMNEKEQHSI